MEFALSAIDGLGLDIDRTSSMVVTLMAYVRGFVLGELAEEDDDEWRAGQEPYVRFLVASGRYPMFTRFVTEARLPHARGDRQASLFESALSDCSTASRPGFRPGQTQDGKGRAAGHQRGTQTRHRRPSAAWSSATSTWYWSCCRSDDGSRPKLVAQDLPEVEVDLQGLAPPP